MQEFIDYYRVLQVHYLADQEVVESAYKRLAKKYHPDLNKSKNAQSVMQKINCAYEVIGDADKRCKYHVLWEEKVLKNDNSSNQSFEKIYSDARRVLDDYFRNIMENICEASYQLISNNDKAYISQSDFIVWQHMVSIVYQLKNYSCKVENSVKNKVLEGVRYKEVVEISVVILEYNAIMDLPEKNTIKKLVVLEDGVWHVHLGYKDLKPVINKLKSLTSLLTAKSVVNEMTESQSKIDNLTGLLNKKGIVEKLEAEVSRYNRYGNVFSLVLCEIDPLNPNKWSKEQKENVIRNIANLFTENLRNLDIIGRWNERTFLLLLPETSLYGAKKVACKLGKLLDAQKKDYECRFASSEYSNSLKMTLEVLNN